MKGERGETRKNECLTADFSQTTRLDVGSLYMSMCMSFTVREFIKNSMLGKWMVDL